jgi:hypothetical protein
LLYLLQNLGCVIGALVGFLDGTQECIYCAAFCKAAQENSDENEV